ncbi:MAG: hypothetical protein ACYCWE_03095 [Eubacteriales bacterium]
MNNNKPKTDIQMRIINTAEELWSNRFHWTKEYITSVVCNFNNLSYVTQRFYECCRNFANEFRKYYGYDKARKFESLLVDFFNITTTVLNDIKVGDNESLAGNKILWYKNADEFADFLSGINPYWSKDVWQDLMYGHLELIEDEAKFALKTICTAGLVSRDDVYKQMKAMADYMAEGIIQQFKI